MKSERSKSQHASPQVTIASKIRGKLASAKSASKGSTPTSSTSTKSKTSPRTPSTKRVNNSPLGNVQKQPKPGSQSKPNTVSKLDKSNSKVS